MNATDISFEIILKKCFFLATEKCEKEDYPDTFDELVSYQLFVALFKNRFNVGKHHNYQMLTIQRNCNIQ